jgi:site-specific DNA-methyltransferase (cytosine-N4-specific)
VLDIFAGSNLTGRVAQDLDRNWLSFEREEQYIQTSQFRFLEMEEIKKLKQEDQSGFGDFEEVTTQD